jgi:hypothetical protein
MSKIESNIVIVVLLVVIIFAILKPLFAAIFGIGALIVFIVYRFLKIKNIL